MFLTYKFFQNVFSSILKRNTLQQYVDYFWWKCKLFDITGYGYKLVYDGPNLGSRHNGHVAEMFCFRILVRMNILWI
jgi:hypothetical protein